MTMLTRPITVQWEITDNCNLRCRHCYLYNFDKEICRENLADEEMMKIAKIIVNEGIFRIVLTGGEPLLRTDLAVTLSKYFKKEGLISVSLNTNLLLLNKDKLNKLKNSGIDSLLISCPSANKETYREMTGGGSFERFLENLHLIIKSQIRFSINMVVNKRNIEHLEMTALKMKEIGVKSFGATPMTLSASNPDANSLLSREQVINLLQRLVKIGDKTGLNIDVFEALPNCIFDEIPNLTRYPFLKRKCQAGRTVAAIGSTGNIRACSHLTEVYGNIFKDENLNLSWSKMDCWRGENAVPEECIKCGSFNNCLGGCRASAQTVSGEFRGNEPWMTNSLTRETIKAKNKKIQLNESNTLSLAKSVNWRKESDSYYLIYSGGSNGKTTFINPALFNFFTLAKNKLPLSINELAINSGTSFEDKEYQRVISLLVERSIFNIN